MNDGYRAFLVVKNGDVQILARKGNDLTQTYPNIVAQAKRINARDAMIDGEIAALDPKGRISFQALQRRGSEKVREIRYYGFDLLSRDGKDLKSKGIEERRAQLADVLRDSGLGMTVELPDTATALAIASQFGFEGVIAKLRGSLYIPPRSPRARSPAWLTWKRQQQQEFVVGGFHAEGTAIYELLIGYYDDEQHLHFASKVKDGFVSHDRRKIFQLLQPLLVSVCPFVNLPTSARESSRWGGGVSAADMKCAGSNRSSSFRYGFWNGLRRRASGTLHFSGCEMTKKSEACAAGVGTRCRLPSDTYLELAC